MTKGTLRLITCGSVDDGKSTLIGRMLHDCGAIPDDLVERLEKDSQRFGTRGRELDFALVADGLEAEREQGITIDVAYRYFATPNRRFILADSPGHEQYTANMVTAASTAQLAIMLVDASKGILPQTRRHSYLARLMGIDHVVLAVNKMDLVGWSREVFDCIERSYSELASSLGIDKIFSMPISAVSGANLVTSGEESPWYDGPPLLQYLDEVEIEAGPKETGPFRMPVQWVNRPHDGFRGYCGTIAGGGVHTGEEVMVLPAGTRTRIEQILVADHESQSAGTKQVVTLRFSHEVECSRGSVIAVPEDPPVVADQFEATIIWMAEEELQPGRQYMLKLATQTVTAIVQKPKYEVNVDTLEHLATRTLQLNSIGVANVWTDRPIVFDPYDQNRGLGGFILIDRFSNATMAAGLIHFPLRRSIHVHEQMLDVTPERRAALKFQRPKLIWFTGLSGAGKSTIANIVERRLNGEGRHSFLLDGDNIRLGLNRDLGFTEADRIENIRRVGEVAKLMMEAGLIVLAAFISPFRADRQLIRDLLPEGDFIEIFVDTPLAEAEGRDVKGLYRRARAGELPNFTGIDSPYEAPQNPDIRIDTSVQSAEEAADTILSYLSSRITPEISD